MTIFRFLKRLRLRRGRKNPLQRRHESEETIESSSSASAAASSPPTTTSTIQSQCSFETAATSSAAANEAEPQKQQRSMSKKQVSFSSVSIRSYDVVLGDHPYCQDGCALTLGWDYVEHGGCDDHDHDDDKDRGEGDQPHQKETHTEAAAKQADNASSKKKSTPLDEYEEYRAETKRRRAAELCSKMKDSSRYNNNKCFKTSQEERRNRLALSMPEMRRVCRANQRNRARRIRTAEHRIFFNE